MNELGYRVHVTNQWAHDAIGLHLGSRLWRDGAVETRIAEHATLSFVPHDEAVALPWQPTLQMPRELGRVLLDELTTFFGGVSNERMLRKDYDAERVRVDKFIAHLTGGQK